METKKLVPVGLVLRGLRAAAGMTQRAHACAIGLAPAYLSKVESGHKKVPYSRVVELIGALGVGYQAEIQARLAIFHGDGLLSESEVACLVAHHACWPVICLYKSHATFGEALETCAECGARITCRPEGHLCSNGCGGQRPRTKSGGPSSVGSDSRTSIPPEEALW